MTFILVWIYHLLNWDSCLNFTSFVFADTYIIYIIFKNWVGRSKLLPGIQCRCTIWHLITDSSLEFCWEFFTLHLSFTDYKLICIFTEFSLLPQSGLATLIVNQEVTQPLLSRFTISKFRNLILLLSFSIIILIFI